MKVIGIIPARYQASRFPGKLLAEIKGKSVIQRSYENCIKSNLDEVWVASDDERIYDHIKNIGGNVLMTDRDIATGSERCRQAFFNINSDAEAFINIQGDEPLVDPKDINLLIHLISKDHVQIGTLVRSENETSVINNTNRVKVVRDINNKALYFSRHPIPFNRNEQLIPRLIHIGMYAFKASILHQLDSLKDSDLAHAEKLEQLQWLENGIEIHVCETEKSSIPVDTPEDLEFIVKNWNDLHE